MGLNEFKMAKFRTERITIVYKFPLLSRVGGGSGPIIIKVMTIVMSLERNLKMVTETTCGSNSLSS